MPAARQAREPAQAARQQREPALAAEPARPQQEQEAQPVAEAAPAPAMPVSARRVEVSLRNRQRGASRSRPALFRLLRREIGIEPELVISDPDHVGPGQHPLPLDPLAVDEGAVGAAVHQHVALRSRHDLGVAAGDILVRHHDVAARLAAEDQRRGADGVLPAVGQTDQPAAGGRGGRLWGARTWTAPPSWPRRWTDELGAAAAAGIGHQNLVRPDLQLVAMKDGSRLGSQPDAVEQNFRLGARTNRSGAVGDCPE